MPTKTLIPLESNPEIFTSLAHKLGLINLLSFQDIYTLSDEQFIEPIYSVILLLPIAGAYDADTKASYKNSGIYDYELASHIRWFKQVLKNGCGLYALINILCNLPDELIVSSSLASSLIECHDNSEGDKEKETGAKITEIEERLYENYSKQGQTEAPEATDDVNLHFIVFTKGLDNHLYELDGRRNGPLDLGDIGEVRNIFGETLISKIQFYMDNTDEENMNNFAIMGLGPSLDFD